MVGSRAAKGEEKKPPFARLFPSRLTILDLVEEVFLVIQTFGFGTRER